MPSDSDSAAPYEFKIGGVHVSTCVAEKPWLVNFFFNQEKIPRPSIVGLSIHGYAPGDDISYYLQLCIGNRCLMIRMLDLYSHIPSSLKEFLVDEHICFVGVNMKDTLATLESYHRLQFGTNNWKDLGEWAAAISNHHGCSTSKSSCSGSNSTSDCGDEEEEEEKPIDQLVRLAREYGGGLNLERTTQLNNSSWAGYDTRTTEQIYYATLDAYAAYLIGDKLLQLDRLTPLIEWFS